MRALLRLIDRLGLGTPDDFAGDPYGWATNGLSHVALGAGGAWLGGQIGMSPPVVLAIAAAIVLAVEVLHLGRGGSWRDGLVDAGLVLGGVRDLPRPSAVRGARRHPRSRDLAACPEPGGMSGCTACSAARL